MPRKKLEWDAEQVETFKGLCMIFCTEDEICLVMRVTPAQLETLVNKYFRVEVTGKASERITFDDAFDYFSANGKMSLRRRQYELAMDGDRSMLVWLGKQYLGQKDPDKAAKQPAKPKQAAQVSAISDFRARSPVVKAATG